MGSRYRRRPGSHLRRSSPGDGDDHRRRQADAARRRWRNPAGRVGSDHVTFNDHHAFDLAPDGDAHPDCCAPGHGPDRVISHPAGIFVPDVRFSAYHHRPPPSIADRHLCALARYRNLCAPAGCHRPPPPIADRNLCALASYRNRARPLTTYRTVIELIAATTTQTGLRIEADLDDRSYPIGVKVTDKQLAAIPMRRHDWQPAWNYTIAPP